MGKQYLSRNNYQIEYDVIRKYLYDEVKKSGVKASDIKKHCNCQMYSHWFTKHQFVLIPEHQYTILQSVYKGYFTKPWNELHQLWKDIKNKSSYFDNTHESMHDVWSFSRVIGEERYNHATPKPVDMMERIMNSSLPKDGLCVEPFGGTGSTLMGAETTGRRCYIMELDPKYCDIIIQRWERYTGKKAVLSV